MQEIPLLMQDAPSNIETEAKHIQSLEQSIPIFEIQLKQRIERKKVLEEQVKVWKEFKDKLPDNIEDYSQQVNNYLEESVSGAISLNNEFSETIEKEEKLILKVDVKIRNLKSELNVKTDRKQLLEEQLKGWNEFKQDFPDLLETCKSISQVENTLAQQVNHQLEVNTNRFRALSDETSDDPPLSLIFNSCEISCETIKILEGVKASKFIFDRLHESYPSEDLPSLGDLLDIEYCQRMILAKQIPYDNHFKRCSICKHPVETVHELLTENQIDFTEVDLLVENNINGPRLLMLHLNDLTSGPFNIAS